MSNNSQFKGGDVYDFQGTPVVIDDGKISPDLPDLKIDIAGSTGDTLVEYLPETFDENIAEHWRTVKDSDGNDLPCKQNDYLSLKGIGRVKAVRLTPANNGTFRYQWSQ